MTVRQLLRHRLCKRLRKMRDPRFADVAPFWCEHDVRDYEAVIERYVLSSHAWVGTTI